MKNYQRILEELQRAIRHKEKGFDELLPQFSSGSAGKMLFLNIHTGRAICNGTAFILDPNCPQALESYLRLHEPCYIILLVTSSENPDEVVKVPPGSMRPEGLWGSSVWEVYRELYDKPSKSWEEEARLELLFCSLLLSQNKLVKIKYFERSLVNIFGWIYEREAGFITDINLDVFFTFDEEYLLDEGSMNGQGYLEATTQYR